MSRRQYEGAVESVRDGIRAGAVYQANICRVLSAPLWPRPDAPALAADLAEGNPAPYAGFVDVPPGLHDAAGAPVPEAWVVTASPELGLALQEGVVTSGPIKGTAAHVDGLLEKDRAENLMITDLVRHDLHRVCLPGTVTVSDLMSVEHHPGLVHLVSRVRGRLAVALDATGWAELLAATQPPGSVSGAPKHAALGVIAELETERRGPYCGHIGWIDADARAAVLAVGIRTFWWGAGTLRFGTGAGFTYGSDPATEWEETRLKAATLVGLASGGSGRTSTPGLA